MKLARIKGDCIELNQGWDIGDTKFKRPYRIEIHRLDENEDINWLEHLREKSWFSRQMEQEFVQLCKQVKT